MKGLRENEGEEIMKMTYEDFKKDIKKLRMYIENTVDPHMKSDFSAELIWLIVKYPDYFLKMKLEGMDE